MLPAIAAEIKKRLGQNLRCLYLNSPIMVVGIRSYLFAAGVDVAAELQRGSLVLSSDQSHLRGNRFEPDAMLQLIEEALESAISDGFAGLWATGDMSWELGLDNDLTTLLHYEWKLEEFFKTHPNLFGVCQYHAEFLSRDIVNHGALIHPALFINQTLSRINPHYFSSDSPLLPQSMTRELRHTVQNLCALQPRDDVDQ
jgi:hypothetical protein